MHWKKGSQLRDAARILLLQASVVHYTKHKKATPHIVGAWITAVCPLTPFDKFYYSSSSPCKNTSGLNFHSCLHCLLREI